MDRNVFINYITRHIDRGTARAIKAQSDIARSAQKAGQVQADQYDLAARAAQRYQRAAFASGRRVAQSNMTAERSTRQLGRSAEALGKGLRYLTTTMAGFSRGSNRVIDDLRNLNVVFSAFRNAVLTLRLPAAIATFGFLTQALGAATGAVVALTGALGPLSGALIALPALIGGVAQGVLTFRLALSGVQDTLQAFDRQALGAGRSARQMADQTEAAAERVRDAQERVRDAQDAVRRSQRELTVAQREARRELVDLALAAEGAANSELRAELALRQARAEAQRVAADPNATGFDRQQAVLDVRDAELALKDAQVGRDRAQAELTRRERDGSQIIVQAREQQEGALRNLTAAQRDLNNALKEQAAGPDPAGGADRAAALYDRLSKEGKQFVDFYRSTIQPAIDDVLQPAAGRQLFPGLIEGASAAMKNLQPLARVLEVTGGAFGRLAAKLGEVLGSREFGGMLERIGASNAGWIEKLGGAAIRLGLSLTRLLDAARPFLDWLVDATVRMSDFVSNAMTAGAESGRFAGFLDRTRGVMVRLGSIIKSLSNAFYEIFKGGSNLGLELLSSIDRNAKAFSDWTESASGRNSIRQYFEDIKPAVYAISELVLEIIKSFVRLSADPGVAKLTDVLRTNLLPVLEETISMTTRAFGPSFVDLLAAMLKLFQAMAGPISVVMNVLAKMAEAVAQIVQFDLGKALGLGTSIQPILFAVQALVGFVAAMKALRLAKAILGYNQLKDAVQRLGVTFRTSAKAGEAMEQQATAAGNAAANAARRTAMADKSMIRPYKGKGAKGRRAEDLAKQKAMADAAAAAAYQSTYDEYIDANTPMGMKPGKKGGDQRPLSRGARLRGALRRGAGRGGGAAVGIGGAAATASLLMPQDAEASTGGAGQALNIAATAGMAVAALAGLAPVMSALGAAASGLVALLAPVGAAIAGISLPVVAVVAGLVIAGVAIYKFRDQIWDAMKAVGGAVATAARGVGSALGSIVDFFRRNAQTIVRVIAVITAPLWVPVVAAIAVGARLIQAGLAVLPAIFNAILAVIRGVWAVFRTIIVTPVRAGLRLVVSVLGTLGGLALVPLRAALNLLGSAWDGIKDRFVRPIRGAIDTIVDFLGGVGGRLLSAGKKVGGAILDGVKGAFGDVGDVGKSIIKAIAKAIDDVLPNEIGIGPASVNLPDNPVQSLLGINGYAGGGWIVPGSDRVDGTLAMLSGNEAVLTYSGQAMIEQAAPGLLDAVINRQIPHFASGGRVAQAARKAGFSGNNLVVALAVGKAESQWDPKAVSPPNADRWRSRDHGLWQINDHWHPRYFRQPGRIYDIDYNAQAAYNISSGGRNWQPWTTFRTGASGRYMRDAQQAARSAGGTQRSATSRRPTSRGVQPRRGGTVPMDKPAILRGGQRRYQRSFRYADDPAMLGFNAAVEGNAGYAFYVDLISQISSAMGTTTASVPGAATTGAAASKGSPSRRAGNRRPARTRTPQRSTRGLRPGGGWMGTENIAKSATAGLGRRSYKRPYDTVAGPNMSDHFTGKTNAFAVDLTPPSDGSFRTIKRRLGIPAVMGNGPSDRNGPAFARHRIPGLPGFDAQLLWRVYNHDPAMNPHIHLGVSKRMRRGGRLRGGVPTYRTGKRGKARGKGTMMAGPLRGTGRNAPKPSKPPTYLGTDQASYLEGLEMLAQSVSGAAIGQIATVRSTLQEELNALLRKPQTDEVRQQVQRLQGALTVVDAAAGAYFGPVVKAANDAQARLENQTKAIQRSLAVQGIDEGSSRGQNALLAAARNTQAVLTEQRDKLQQAQAEAARLGLSGVAASIGEQLTTIGEKLADTAVEIAERVRAAALAAAQEAVDSAGFAANVGTNFNPFTGQGLGGSAGLQQLELQQRLAGNFDDAGSRVQRADYIRGNVVTGLSGELDALRGQLATVQREDPNNVPLARQIAEAIAGKQNEILQAQLSAQELIEENTKAAADALKEFTGSAAFEFQGQTFTDNLGVGLGL